MFNVVNINQHKIYFISGVSGVGKTSTLEQLKKILPQNAFDVRDFDERGVPDGGGPKWHDNETRHWLDVATSNAINGKSTVISGFTNPEQFKKVYNPYKDIPAQIILLDVSSDTLRKRLYGRHATPESKQEIERAAGISLNEFVEQCISFAPKLCLIFEQNKFPIINTDKMTPEEVAKEVSVIILKTQSDVKRNRSAGIVIKDNKVLVMHRINKGDEYWVFPGGGQEEGETPDQTAVREIDEETTIKVNIGRLVYHIIWDTGEENFFYLCEYISGEPKLRSDSEEIIQMKNGDQVYEPMWVEIDKLSSLKLYQLEVRDLFLNDYKNGFPEHVQELFIKLAERRRK